MAYTQVGIVNLALYRIGVKKIATMADDTAAAIKANDVWEYIRDEVLQARDWKFAKTRAELTMLEETPLSNWSYAYRLPQDFLRLAFNTEEKDDPVVYPPYFKFSIETIQMTSLVGSVGDFNPASNYAIGDVAKVGPYATIPVTPTKIIYISAPYGDADADTISFTIESNTGDTLSVTESSGLITIKLANADSTKNTAALIQAAIRALGTQPGNDVDVSGWFVTENAAYTAARPTTGIDSGTIYMQGSGYADRVWNCTATVTAGAGNSSYFPPAESSKWSEREGIELAFLTDYNSVSSTQAQEEIVIQYIRKVADVTKYSPAFVNVIAWRLGAELSIGLTEGLNKFKMCVSMAEQALIQATEINNTMTYYNTPDNWTEAHRGY